MNWHIDPYTLEKIIDLVGFIALVSAFFLIFVIVNNIEKIKSLKDSLKKLNESFEELDNQAKLIFRTDLELNKTQSELDKKISCLYTLQKLTRAVSTTLDQAEIFKRLDDDLINRLGFERMLIITAEKQLVIKKITGYSKKEAEDLEIFINKENLFRPLFQTGKSISSIEKPNEKIERLINRIKRVFGVVNFIASPILSKEGILGFLIGGNKSSDMPLTEGDEEIVEILSTQIGQSLENARLFEETYRSHQNLENRVKQRTKELSEALNRIQEISQRKSEFISAVSHELRTPLTSIKGYGSILLSEKLGPIPDAAKKRLEKINLHSNELNKLISDLLDISRIESGKLEMKQKPENLRNLIDEVVDLLMPQIKEKNIKLNLEMPKTLASVFIDSAQIQRVFINLLGNAIKFTPDKGNITIRCKEDKDFTQVDIKDTGIGMPEVDTRRIFNEFYRVDNPINQKVKGAGLGLSIVKYIIEAHKGKIWAKSKVNEGSTFSFTLPKAI